MLPLPKIPGGDVYGIVVQADDVAAARFKVGDRVFGLLPLLFWTYGASAEYIAAPHSLFALAPNLPGPQVAALPLVGLTVLQGMAPVEKAFCGDCKGKRVLVHAGTSSVGNLAVQYCKKALGCYVIATCSAASADMVRRSGADECIDYKTQRFEELVMDLDVIFDVMPYEYEQRSLSSGILKPSGWYVRIAASDMSLQPGDPGTDPLGLAIPEARASELMTVWLKGFRSWFVGPHYHSVFVSPSEGAMDRLADVVSAGYMVPQIDSQFPLEELAKGHERVESGRCKGKVVIIVSPEEISTI